MSVLTHRGDVVGFAAIRAHWLDVGMAEPGFPVNTTEIFQEGVRWGATKILSEGEWVRDVLDLLLLNSRAPRTLMGDLSAQVAAARMGERRYHELIRRFGLDVVRGCTQRIFEATEKKYRDFIASIPDGVYEAEGFADDDFVTRDPIRVKVTVTVAGDEMVIDTTGSAKQCRGNVNCGFPNTVSAARLALAFLFPSPRPEVNHGSFLPLKVVAEPGSVFAAVEPAACMHPHPGMLMLDLVIKALAPVLPRNVAAGLPGDSWNVFVIGKRPGSGEFFVSGEALDGGWGASAPSTTARARSSIPPPEIFAMCPSRLSRAGSPFASEASGSAATARDRESSAAGLNVVKEYEVLSDCRLTLHFDRALTPQWGLFGGGRWARAPGSPCALRTERKSSRF